MGKLKVLAALVSVLLLLSGCRVIWVNPPLEAADAKPQADIPAAGIEPIDIQAYVQYDKRKIVFRGETNLPEGAVIEVSLTQFPEGTDPLNVTNGSVDPLPDTKIGDTGEVAEDGTYLIVLQRDPEKQYQISTQFRPEQQPPQVKETYGETGENIGKSEGLSEYEVDGTSYRGIALYAPLNNVDEPGYYMGKWNLKPEQKDARPY
ncbi:hypothetical protein LCM10_10170 [Rossellomorea aquimaris]|uniref:hypothetical protein n=1 Tax=Rossellomorea aquimaris TaxID=189382 RepID=UPI001CD6AE28|nr:hypothetical protein [Rossellomorea aquimaris]MCA1055350.1 hypothetical protein [Rossellomorea aquimaris]